MGKRKNGNASFISGSVLFLATHFYVGKKITETSKEMKQGMVKAQS